MASGSKATAQFLAQAFAGACLGALGSAGFVGAFEAQRAGDLGRDLAPAFGLLGPLALGVAIALTAWLWALHAPSRLRLGLLLESAKRRHRLVLLGPFLLVGWFVLGHVAREVFTSVALAPQRVGVLLGAVTLAGLWGGSAALELWATRLSRSMARPSLRTCALSLFLSLVGGISLLVFVGETSGTGGSWALFGVLRREELQLAPAVALVAILLGGYAGGLLAVRAGLGRRALLALGGLFVAAVAGFWSARALDERATLRFERSPSLSGSLLALAQSWSDGDGDGHSAHFGGGDCNDAAPDEHPGAIDLPANGRDEDCSGADAAQTAVSAPSSAQTLDAAGQTGGPRASLPAGANVLLLTVDTLRFDLGFTRSPKDRNLSPHLDELASRSTVFESAYSLASYTSKSLGPALIGRYPSETARNFDHFDRFAPEVPFVQERLQKAGITTSAVQGYWYFFAKGYGFERGWDSLDSEAAPRYISVDADASSNGDKVGDRLLAALDALKTNPKPFFLWGHWVDPHAEYVRHEKYQFGRESRDKYDGEVAFVDEQIGRVLAALAESPQAAKTIVIVTSDHGEAFGEHGLIRHGFELWEELVHVPLIIYVPGQPPRRITARRSLIDLTPTLLDAFGVAQQGEFVRGTSLLDDVLGGPAAPRPVFVDMPQGPHNKERRAFYSGSLKLVTSDGRVLGLYDLALDPREKNDLSDDKSLVSKIQAEQAGFVAGLQPLPARR